MSKQGLPPQAVRPMQSSTPIYARGSIMIMHDNASSETPNIFESLPTVQSQDRLLNFDPLSLLDVCFMSCISTPCHGQMIHARPESLDVDERILPTMSLQYLLVNATRVPKTTSRCRRPASCFSVETVESWLGRPTQCSILQPQDWKI